MRIIGIETANIQDAKLFGLRQPTGECFPILRVFKEIRINRNPRGIATV